MDHMARLAQLAIGSQATLPCFAVRYAYTGCTLHLHKASVPLWRGPTGEGWLARGRDPSDTSK